MFGFIVFIIIVLSLSSWPRDRWYGSRHYHGYGYVPYRSYRINPMPRAHRPMMGPRPMGGGFGARPMGGPRGGFGGGHMGGPGGRR